MQARTFIVVLGIDMPGGRSTPDILVDIVDSHSPIFMGGVAGIWNINAPPTRPVPTSSMIFMVFSPVVRNRAANVYQSTPGAGQIPEFLGTELQAGHWIERF